MDASLRDVTATLARWLGQGRRAALATVVAADGSAPRGVGARLAIAGRDDWSGALSGGCTEVAVVEQALRLLAGGSERAAALVSYTKQTMVDVGPACGSTLTVLVEIVDVDLLQALEQLVEVAMGGSPGRYSATYEAQEVALPAPGEVVEIERTGVRSTAAAAPGSSGLRLEVDTVGGSVELHEDVDASLHLVLAGAGDITRELVQLAGRLAWRTTVIDPRRSLLAQLERSCMPTSSIAAWPDAAWDELGVDGRTACVALAHEAHHDEPFLARALGGPAAYVGAVGSRRVQQARREALLERGVAAEDLARLRGPAGLDLGGSSAAEVALAIAAEVVATLHGRGGAPLAAATGPIRAR